MYACMHAHNSMPVCKYARMYAYVYVCMRKDPQAGLMPKAPHEPMAGDDVPEPWEATAVGPGLGCPKAPCSFMVDPWAFKRIPYHDFEVYVYTIKLHAAFG